MNPSQIVKVARREYLTRVRSKAFIIMTVLIPLLMGGYIFVMPLLFTSSGTDELRIAVLDAGTGLAPDLGGHLADIERPRVEVAEQAAVPDDSEGVRQPYTDDDPGRPPRRLPRAHPPTPSSGRAAATTPARPGTP